MSSVARGDVLLNPGGIEDAYLRGLDAAFGGWGGSAEFAWWFRRPVGDRVADLLVVSRDGEPVAGSAVSYRRLALEHGVIVRAGVMTGAWTLPEHRRRGHFVQLIEASRDIAEERGCALLLAMARAGRGSSGPLTRASTARFRTWHLRSAPATASPPGLSEVRPTDEQLAAWFHEQRGRAAFVYPDAELFAQQARLDRADTRVVAAGEGEWVIAEPRAGALAVHAVIAAHGGATPAQLIAALTQAGSACSRPVTAFTADPEAAGAAVAAGFSTTSGELFALTVPGGLGAEEIPGRWDLQELDRA
jgi:GNAT superfamily N-acetyltransferase